MAKFTFFNIGKANAEIDRLNAELVTAKASAGNPEASAQLADALESNTQISAQLDGVNAELVTAKASIAKLQGEVTAGAAKVKEVEASVDAVAAKKAQEIAAKAGAPPVIAKPADAKPATGLSGMDAVRASIRQQLAKINS